MMNIEEDLKSVLTNSFIESSSSTFPLGCSVEVEEGGRSSLEGGSPEDSVGTDIVISPSLHH